MTKPRIVRRRIPAIDTPGFTWGKWALCTPDQPAAYLPCDTWAEAVEACHAWYHHQCT